MLILVRHGETAANAAGELQGRRDIPLNDLGRSQAARLVAVLPAEPALVVCSPLVRAQETAAIALGPTFEVDERWTEVDFGEWEGRRVADLPPGTWAGRNASLHWTPPGGESLAAVGERVAAACADLAGRAARADVVVFTHVSPIKASVAWSLESPVTLARRMFVGLASVTTISVTNGYPVLLTFNEQGHLAG